MNEENFEIYFSMKLVEYIIYNYEIREDNLLLFESKDCFDLFKNIVLAFNELETLDDDVKDNIYKILSRIKEMENLQYDPLEDINEIIVNLNTLTNKESIQKYYQDQLYLRTNKKRVFKYDLKTIYSLKSSLFCSICNDYALLYSHTILDEENFNNTITNINSNDYFSSIMVILEEYPQIFKDELFYKRVCKVLNKIIYNKKLDVKFSGKRLIKNINKIRRK